MRVGRTRRSREQRVADCRVTSEFKSLRSARCIAFHTLFRGCVLIERNNARRRCDDCRLPDVHMSFQSSDSSSSHVSFD